MSKSNRWAAAIRLAVVLTSFAWATAFASAAGTPGGPGGGRQIAGGGALRPGQALTFAKPGGETYFAISLTPNVARPAAVAQDVLVMFDTSASQAGDFRDKAIGALQSFLTGLGSNDRVKILAIDLQTIELTKEFVAPGSAQAQQARCRNCASGFPWARPIWNWGSKQPPEKLRNAPAGRGRAVAYIGDGMSTARLIPNSRMQQLVDRLVGEQVSVDSYAIGPRLDNLLLGALANHTGGMLLVDTDDWNATQVGLLLASSVKEPVLWPQHVQLPTSLADVYPRRLPPLRFDRDTILIGRGKELPTGRSK